MNESAREEAEPRLHDDNGGRDEGVATPASKAAPVDFPDVARVACLLGWSAERLAREASALVKCANAIASAKVHDEGGLVAALEAIQAPWSTLALLLITAQRRHGDESRKMRTKRYRRALRRVSTAALVIAIPELNTDELESLLPELEWILGGQPELARKWAAEAGALGAAARAALTPPKAVERPVPRVTSGRQDDGEEKATQLAQSQPGGSAPTDLRYILAVLRAGGQEEVTLIEPASVLVEVGRSSTSDIVIADEAVSRQHCSLHVDHRGVVVEDRSVNGTFVNGERISSPSLIALGTTVVVGNAELTLRVAEFRGSTARFRELVEARVCNILSGSKLAALVSWSERERDRLQFVERCLRVGSFLAMAQASPFDAARALMSAKEARGPWSMGSWVRLSRNLAGLATTPPEIARFLTCAAPGDIDACVGARNDLHHGRRPDGLEVAADVFASFVAAAEHIPDLLVNDGSVRFGDRDVSPVIRWEEPSFVIASTPVPMGSTDWEPIEGSRRGHPGP